MLQDLRPMFRGYINSLIVHELAKLQRVLHPPLPDLMDQGPIRRSRPSPDYVPLIVQTDEFPLQRAGGQFRLQHAMQVLHMPPRRAEAGQESLRHLVRAILHLVLQAVRCPLHEHEGGQGRVPWLTSSDLLQLNHIVDDAGAGVQGVELAFPHEFQHLRHATGSLLRIAVRIPVQRIDLIQGRRLALLRHLLHGRSDVDSAFERRLDVPQDQAVMASCKGLLQQRPDSPPVQRLKAHVDVGWVLQAKEEALLDWLLRLAIDLLYFIDQVSYIRVEDQTLSAGNIQDHIASAPPDPDRLPVVPCHLRAGEESLEVRALEPAEPPLFLCRFDPLRDPCVLLCQASMVS